jgi:hypothetical protein
MEKDIVVRCDLPENIRQRDAECRRLGEMANANRKSSRITWFS